MHSAAQFLRSVYAIFTAVMPPSAVATDSYGQAGRLGFTTHFLSSLGQ